MNRKQLSLGLAIGAPVLIIFILMTAVYLPKLMAPEPNYDLFYASPEDHYSYSYRSRRFDRPSGPRFKQKLETMSDSGVVFYRYKIGVERSDTVPVQAVRDNIVVGSESPDGWRVKPGREVDQDFVFVETHEDYDRRVLAGHGTAIKLSIPEEQSDHFLFLGWVKRNDG